MLVRRFVKSWKGLLIFLLSCFSAFCILLVFTGMQTQWITEQENDRLNKYVSEIEDWRQCFMDKNLYKIDGVEYIKLSEVQECRK